MSRRRVVVKVGSSSITDAAGRPSDPALRALAAQIAAVTPSAEVVLVSSGAIASGRGVVNAAARRDVAELQALAAVGQGLLMARYTRVFGEAGLQIGQVLFTGHDFGERRAYLNARNTLERLLEWGVVPVVNENDTTATEEISLGENDRLAALVATMLRADVLVILTDTAGLFSADPRLSAEATLIEEVAEIDAELESVAGESQSGVGSGGMASKVAAAKIASWSGVECVIAAAQEPEVLMRALAGDPVGTRVRARTQRLPARKVWIAFAQQPAGSLVIDGGAVRALEHGRSLLPVGIRDVTGDFGAGAAVAILDQSGGLVAKGLAGASADVLRTVRGTKADDLPAGVPVEAIHRDDLVLLTRPAEVSP
jgi:glutamate 5-kinase